MTHIYLGPFLHVDYALPAHILCSTRGPLDLTTRDFCRTPDKHRFEMRAVAGPAKYAELWAFGLFKGFWTTALRALEGQIASKGPVVKFYVNLAGVVASRPEATP